MVFVVEMLFWWAILPASFLWMLVVMRRLDLSNLRDLCRGRREWEANCPRFNWRRWAYRSAALVLLGSIIIAVFRWTPATGQQVAQYVLGVVAAAMLATIGETQEAGG